MKKMQLHRLFFIGFIVLLATGCEKKQDLVKLNEFTRFQQVKWNKKLTDVVIRDIFTPPVASRIYAYPNIAAYEALLPQHPGNKSLAGQLNGLTELPKPEQGKEYYFPVSSMIAFSTVSKKMILTSVEIEDYENAYINSIKEIGINKEVLQNSIDFGKKVGDHIVNWASQDHYSELRTYPRFILSGVTGEWEPTPPDYMQAVEPHWNKLRAFTLDSCSQFIPQRPSAFDTAKNSKFYKEAMEVYTLGKIYREKLDDENLQIARFWDCNPNISYTKGHVMLFRQKISPGGHWVSITSIAAKQKNLEPIETCETFAKVTIALADAFISCWDEKYRSLHIRPETYIEKYIDPSWDPLLQTPPFPEYPSGHSVISSAAATTLTSIFGDSFSFTDSTEYEFGLTVRKYNSFYDASNEAAISRLYGGIHFRPAIENGMSQGKEVGKFVVGKLTTKATPLAGGIK